MSANVTAIPKGAPSLDRENYRHISIIQILAKVTAIPKGVHALIVKTMDPFQQSPFCLKCEKLVPPKLSSFREKYHSLQTAQFADSKGVGCTDALHAYHISSPSKVLR